MKKFYFLSLALAALMLGSCSDNDDVVVGGDTTQTTDDKGYVTVKINLPTTNSTRAANDNYDDGLASEYAVNDATLLLFSGQNKTSATLQAAYDLSLQWNNSLDNDNITSTAQKTVQIKSISGTTIWALVVLNKNGLFTINTENNLLIDGTAFTGTYAQFMAKGTELINEVADFTDNGIFMTNAVLVDKDGSVALSGQTTTSLVSVLGKIHDTADAASLDPVEICVERAVAKVQVTDGTTTGSSFSVLSGGSTATVSYSIAGWALANENTTSYLARNWGEYTDDVATLSSLTTPPGDDWYALTSNGTSEAITANPYRFAGTVAISSTVPLYRTYFGLDPNYNTTCTFDAITDVSNTADADHYVYCLENTFNVSHQNVENTTCVIVKATLTSDAFSDGKFYTVGGDATNVYTETSAQDYCGSQLINLKSATQLAALLDPNYDATALNTYYDDITATAVVFEDTGAGAVSIASISLKGNKVVGDTDPTTTSLENTITDSSVLSEVASVANVSRYVNGTAYYTVLIKHFGDDLTPWRDTESPTPAVGNIYPSDNCDGNYLGRYGVLRNNWYIIDVTGVTGIGSATIPSVNTDPTTDDQLNTYISTKINILSWAKRTQSVTLE